LRPGTAVRIVQSTKLPTVATPQRGQLGLVIDFYTHPLYAKGFETDLTEGNWYSVMVGGEVRRFREDFLEGVS